MDNSQIAILISVVSILVATFSLGWNVYRDVILKPKVVVSLAKKNIIGAGVTPSPDYIGIHAVNHGPGKVILNTIILKDSSFLKRLKKKEIHAVMMHDWTNPHSSSLPAKLDVGESIDLFAPYDKECFLKESYTHLGLSDSFGRSNWADVKDIIKLKEKWSQDHE